MGVVRRLEGYWGSPEYRGQAKIQNLGKSNSEETSRAGQDGGRQHTQFRQMSFMTSEDWVGLI